MFNFCYNVCVLHDLLWEFVDASHFNSKGSRIYLNFDGLGMGLEGIEHFEKRDRDVVCDKLFHRTVVG